MPREGVEPSEGPGLSRPRLPDYVTWAFANILHTEIGVTGGSRTHTPPRGTGSQPATYAIPPQ